MKKITISIKTDDASFVDSPEETLDYILAQVNKAFRRRESCCKLRDMNGNTVGEYKAN